MTLDNTIYVSLIFSSAFFPPLISCTLKHVSLYLSRTGMSPCSAKPSRADAVHTGSNMSVTRPAFSHPEKKSSSSLPILRRQLINRVGCCNCICFHAAEVETLVIIHFRVKSNAILAVVFISDMVTFLWSSELPATAGLSIGLQELRRKHRVFINFGYCFTSTTSKGRMSTSTQHIENDDQKGNTSHIVGCHYQ